ncbi:MAG: FtsX-like permease family protein [Duncaniella sp.]|nr:FtsX-like permease family protein [Duncaniella sp.]
MKRKLFKQILSERKANAWLVTELVIILVVTWFLVDLMCQIYVPMFEPKGFDTTNCYKLKIALSEGEVSDSAVSLTEQRRELLSRLRHYPGVEAVSVSLQSVEPYSTGMSSGTVVDVTTTDSVTYGFSDDMSLRIGYINPDFVRVFRVSGPRGESPESIARMLEGGTDRILLSSNFVEMIDSGLPVPDPYSLVGHRFMNYGTDYSLVGIVNNVRRSDIEPGSRYAVLLLPFVESDNRAMLCFDNGTDVAIRVDPSADKDFMKRFRRDMGTHLSLSRIYVTDIIPFDDVAAATMADEFKTVRKMYLIVGFLLVNVFLGLLGTFWYRTRQRTSEIAVRMSFGASRASVFRRLTSEGVILLLIAAVVAAVIIGVMLNVEIRPQITYMPHIEVSWIIRNSVMTFLLLLLTVFLGIWFPARAAMRVNPATALHDE